MINQSAAETTEMEQVNLSMAVMPDPKFRNIRAI
jgi:hypothetical protein